MRRIPLLVMAIGSLLGPVLAAAPASAQATRTWVSGVGDDVNPCSRTAPCKTFAGAISKTATAGEINCLDPGGFGTVTITKSMTLNCHEVLGSILASGVPGITINATAAGSRVILRGLQINGVQGGTAVPGTIGIRILAAAVVVIEDTVVTQFAQQGIADQRTAGGTQMFIRNSVISNNIGSGIALTASGPFGNSVELENVSSIRNQFGVAAGSGNNAMIRRSVFSGNSDSGLEADGGGQINAIDTVISTNNIGVQANGTIRLANSDISFNSTAVTGSGGQTYGNNRISGNSALGSALAAASPGQQ